MSHIIAGSLRAVVPAFGIFAKRTPQGLSHLFPKTVPNLHARAFRASRSEAPVTIPVRLIPTKKLASNAEDQFLKVLNHGSISNLQLALKQLYQECFLPCTNDYDSGWSTNQYYPGKFTVVEWVYMKLAKKLSNDQKVLLLEVAAKSPRAQEFGYNPVHLAILLDQQLEKNLLLFLFNMNPSWFCQTDKEELTPALLAVACSISKKTIADTIYFQNNHRQLTDTERQKLVHAAGLPFLI